MTSTRANGIVRMGGGAGYSGDRVDPAGGLATHGDLDYLVFECLAERTIAIAQQARTHDPAGGYDALLVERMEAVLPACLERGTGVITNMGAANPKAAAARIAQLARDRGWHGLTIAAVTGDDVLTQVSGGRHDMLETGQPVSALGSLLVSANATSVPPPSLRRLRMRRPGHHRTRGRSYLVSRRPGGGLRLAIR